MMNCNTQSRPVSSSLPMQVGLRVDTLSKHSSAKDRIDPPVHKRQPSRGKLIRHQSSSSCYSTQSFASNATGSSERTHRRCRIEVSCYFSPGGTTEQTTETADACVKQSSSAMQPTHRRQVSDSPGSDSMPTSEMRGPASDQVVVSPGSCSRVRDQPTSPIKACTESKKGHHDAVAIVSVGKNPQVNNDLEDLIRELSFSPPKKKTPFAAMIAVSPSTPPRVLPDEVSEGNGFEPICVEMEESNELVAPSALGLEMEEEHNELPPLAPSSPPLPPKIERQLSMPDVPSQVMHNRNRARSTSISEMSGSYFDGFVQDAEESSSNSSNDQEESADKEYLITIDNVPAAKLAPRPTPLWNRARSSTYGSVVSAQSSYVSSTSSSSAFLSVESQGQEEEDLIIEDQVQSPLTDEDSSFNQEVGHLSLQEDKLCKTHRRSDSSAELYDCRVLHRQLTAESLREWNMMCEEESSQKGIAKNQFIFRALGKTSSCPNKMNAAASPGRGSNMDSPQENDDESVEEPHLMAAPGGPHLISQSLFSYTNSCAASTISSEKNDNLDDIISDLDFDMHFIYSYSIENKPSADTPLDGRLNKNHRRNLSAGLPRISSLPKTMLHNESGRLDKTSCPAKHKHRRMKSDGQIFCSSKQKQTILSEATVSFSEGPSFKSKYNPRHQRVKSLGSFKEAEIFDTSFLQSILEEASKTSAGSNSSIGLHSICLVRPLRQQLENLKLGFLLGLFVGVFIPYVFNAVLNF